MKRLSLFLIIIAMCGGLFQSHASAQSAITLTVLWDYDASLESSISGFRIYYGTTSHAGVADPAANDGVDSSPYDAVVDVANPSARSHALSVPTGVYFLRMTAYGDVGGVLDDSAFNSDEHQCQVGLLPPSGLSCAVTFTFP